MIRRVRARLSRIVSSGLGWLASRSPRVAFLVSDALGFIRALPTARDRRMWMTHMRTQLLVGWAERGGSAQIRALVRPNAAIAALRPPMILGTFHVGPILGLGVLSERLNGDLFVLRGSVGSTDQQRAATFHRAIEQLRATGFIVMALDPYEAQRIAVPFLGRTLHLARGAFAMARIARVPIVPVVARWDGDAIELIVGDALHGSDDEQQMAEAAGRWLEGYVRARPEELSYRIRELMS